MTEFPEPEGKTPGGLKLLVVGMALYALGVCAATVVILWRMGAAA
ncbi:hypothetical protein [Asticcacaulis taihuensis]|nr:hypothetical protein [Asticcacaulis taihuensis]